MQLEGNFSEQQLLIGCPFLPPNSFSAIILRINEMWITWWRLLLKPLLLFFLTWDIWCLEQVMRSLSEESMDAAATLQPISSIDNAEITVESQSLPLQVWYLQV
jgi:hypothetical protein